jgi:methylated-DNA-[protein]-cysteine S-methyltransferase
MVDRGGIADQTNPFTAKRTGFEQACGTKDDVHAAHYHRLRGLAPDPWSIIAGSVQYRLLESPIGPLLLAGDDHGVRFLLFGNGRHAAVPQPDWEPDVGLLAEPTRQLNAYFKGKLRDFEVPVSPGGTPFQRSVWDALQEIPYGETVSYGELARRLGNPKAVRAVGLANGANPISIIIPCHRVIGSTGALVGYGGGLATKQALIALERGQRTLL